MAQFPREDVILTYRCGACGEIYSPTEQSRIQQCLVLHGPGDCCHYLESKISTKEESMSSEQGS